jgi:PiT family inorganic phosphate transporter
MMFDLFILLTVLALVCLGGIFAYSNGFQDGSSVAASPIACRAMSQYQAIVLTVIFEFCGAIFGGSLVANSICGITSYPRNGSFLLMVACALVAATYWNFLTRVLKVPSSSTHALVGGLVGAVYGHTNSFEYINFGAFHIGMQSTGVAKVISALFLSPLIGFFVGFWALKFLYLFLMGASTKVNRVFKGFQWISLPALAFGHGANDSQKIMGLLSACLTVKGLHEGWFFYPLNVSDSIPLVVRVLIGCAIGAGVLAMVPGLVKRIGSGIYKQRPVHGFVSEFCAAAIILTGSLTGGPVSASQVIASCVMGVGCADRGKGVHWLVAQEMLLAWFCTIPASALIGFLLAKLLLLFP